MIELRTNDGALYQLDDEGAVVARSNGPKGWNYSGKWIIRGFLRRWNSSVMVPLDDALDGADIGHGYVVDVDHGTWRVWMGAGSRCKSLSRTN
jgi:hypothetical protein